MRLMLRRKRDTSNNAEWERAEAEVVSTKAGFIHESGAGLGIGGGYATSASNMTYHLKVYPAVGPPYDATLKASWKDAAADRPPTIPGTRFEVLVDKSEARHVALPPNPTYLLPSGQEWAPTQGLSGALRAAAERGDAAEIARLTAQLRSQTAPGAGREPTTPGTTVDSQLQRLEKLGQLRANGVLSDQEFEAQKQRILAEG
jgi:hypothetical protein